MKIDIDTYKEILDTITRNKSRSILTGFGVFWGVFMLVALIGGGQGLKQLLQSNFEGFATNSAIIFSQKTTKAYHGFRKGRYWTMTSQDIKRLKEQVPGLDVVVPQLSQWGTSAIRGDKKCSGPLKGMMPEYQLIDAPVMRYGRYINEMDVREDRKVCVLGKQIYKTLFPENIDPCGQVIRVDSTYYTVIGVDYSTSSMNINGSSQNSIVVPYTLLQRLYNRGDEIDLICLTAKPGVVISEITPRIREVVARPHDIDPTDEKAVTVFNTEVLFGLLDNLFKGVNFLIWLVGIGTLLAGAIGVSNIMMVTVRERTTEIGIRRAIGATPKVILSQIISESIALTAVAGMSGILFAVAILQMLQLANTTDGIEAAHYQVDFWTALGAVAMLMVLGILAGLAPALRAMNIKPVDAMRDE